MSMIWRPKKCTLLDEKEDGGEEYPKRKGKGMAIYGYARASAGKSLKVQGQVLSEEVNEENIVTDSAGSGGFCALLQRLQPGDLLIVQSLEALGGSYEVVLRAWKQVTEEAGADILVQEMPLLDTRKSGNGVPVSGIVEQVLGFAAEKERQRTSLQAQGIAAAKERGVRFGRPRVEAFRKRQITLLQALARTGIKKSAFYYHLKKLEEQGFISEGTSAHR